ncbi:uncharacterized protein cubi_02436 [Cryptosporidium ubiquitum]|uniref:Secreted protein n=1 Tax=Cryptosporidium ubiquitum TaxID=857276 RepID=A0A1J4MJL4_9CRYT|nr:uncharacterized protein cubi_02436 [Cryptosporidium ubiquitum]OII73204.1 hypothetical protein cubi_02436 [Cryptosporidium ubiquitum]
MNKNKCVLRAIGCIILAIGGVFGSESDLYASGTFGYVSEKSSSPSSLAADNYDSSTPGEDFPGIIGGSEATTSSGSFEAAGYDMSKPSIQEDFVSGGSGGDDTVAHLDLSGEPSEALSSGFHEVTADPSLLSQQKLSEFVGRSTEISKPEEKSSSLGFVITKNAEIAIDNLFPTVDSANILTVSDILKYPSVELNDEKVLVSQLSNKIHYYKVEPPMIHDATSGLSTSDPRVEIGVKPKFELFVEENQPRMERILRFLDLNHSDLVGQEKIDLAILLFSVVTYGECNKKLKGINSNLEVVEMCNQLSREDILTIQPEDLPKNVIKEKIELFKLSGLVLSVPLPLFTNASDLKWRHVTNPDGIYQVYNGGAIDGFAHLDFLYKKLYDITNFLYYPGFQFMDDTRLELYYGLKGIRVRLGQIEQTRKVKKDLSKVMDFYNNWFKGPKFKKACSREYSNAMIAMAPIYDAISEMNKILRSVQNEISTNPRILEEDFVGIPKQVLMNINPNEKKFFLNNIVPIFTIINNGIKKGKIKTMRAEVLRILAILEEIEFNSKEVARILQDLQKCIRGSGNAFKYELRYIKRDFYRLVRVVRKSDPKFPFPFPSSPLYIKGRKFGIKNLFRKNSARAKLGYYREFLPFNKSEKASKK